MKTVKLSIIYPVNKVTQPVVSTLIKKYNLEVNILHADVSLTKVGTLVADISGEDADVDAALQYLSDAEVEYKLFTRKLIWDEARCVHCGACTAVCPFGALSMGGDDWSLAFDREKCVVCGLCTKACPLSVMSLQ